MMKAIHFFVKYEVGLQQRFLGQNWTFSNKMLSLAAYIFLKMLNKYGQIIENGYVCNYLIESFNKGEKLP